MEKGEIRRSVHIDQNTRVIPEFIQEVIADLREQIGDDQPENLHISYSKLESEFHQGASPVVFGDNILTIVWHNDVPAALVLATRDGFNYTHLELVYLGPNFPEDQA